MKAVDDLRKHAAELLIEGKISALVGYAESTLKGKIRPLIVWDAS